MISSMIIAIITIESAFNPIAASPANAHGLMQMTPIGIKEARRQCVLPIGSQNNWQISLEYGTCLYKFYLSKQNHLDLEALICYNGGYRQVIRWKQGKLIARESLSYAYKVLKKKDEIDAKDCKLLNNCTYYVSTNEYSLWENSRFEKHSINPRSDYSRIPQGPQQQDQDHK